ncbi:MULTISPECIES: histidine triad nucleotide-binding protein [unclassified Candidatus Frackibacter]|uniref:histidine triad nucleotide-binding protein n=1 Tax=unclassified Candidatus Frackibacter TaxID=2648818 RepID=UPI00079A16CD|nr:MULTISPECIES: histidine triad nucleotide-binding protein [unclassified Candidatus Frackibacter]KXS41117.1 MAG: Hit-like protein involved in cell-cycle regulation [Candidatus Frackibacter sp. T328-2]SDC73865.1 histidine triad (HIT) family protein [Candidatus Frackibacter sp. WG11]SEM87943.1 histidine triad (HIT) family protein [Candidatus Frackibacter sp. WG12]SFL97256.1 histidine triad (HIT) family protein [Candidatus Frackibacter sp. WG13]
MSDCLFCGIANHEIESDIIYEDEKVVAFRDIEPQAPVHILIVPKKHIATTLELEAEDKELIGHIYQVANQLATDEGIAEDGFRIVNNCNEDGGQTVFHLHFHLLGGRQLQWPPG